MERGEQPENTRESGVTSVSLTEIESQGILYTSGAEFDMLYGEGISREGDLLDLASERGLVQKSGAWYAYQEDRIGQGRENAKKYLKEHPDVATAIALQLRQTLGLTCMAAEPPEGGDLMDALGDHPRVRRPLPRPRVFHPDVLRYGHRPHGAHPRAASPQAGQGRMRSRSSGPHAQGLGPQHRRCRIDRASDSAPALLPTPTNGLDPTWGVSSATDPHPRVQWRMGSDLPGVVSSVPCLSPANGGVTPSIKRAPMRLCVRE
jgi:hypothetical protein